MLLGWEQECLSPGVVLRITHTIELKAGLPGGAVVKNLPANTGEAALIPGLGRSPGEGNGNPQKYFFPGKSHDLEVPGRLQSMRSQRVRTWQLSIQAHSKVPN